MAEKGVDFIKWFSELSNKDVPIAGGKGASLSEMYNLKIPVPPGFVVTAQSYIYFLEKTGIKEKIFKVLENLNVDNTAELNACSKKVREIIDNTEFPPEMTEEIKEAYEMLDAKKDQNEDAMKVLEKSEEPFVAVRSSATTEDLVEASFAGQQETFLNVKGPEHLLEKVRKCMSSLFTPRAIFYRDKNNFEHSKSYLAVVVQKMVASDKSGVMFSQNPTKPDKSIMIEAVFGLGEGIVSGQIKPDHYEVDQNLDEFKINEIQVSKKKLAIIKNDKGENETIKLNDEISQKRVLDNYQIKRLAQFARQLEKHYEKPQDIEFAIDESGIYIVQSRPITTTVKVPSKDAKEFEGEAILSGLAASPGVASGIVKIIHDISELEKIKKGDVMVTEMTNPDMVVAMQKSAAIVTDEGGVTSHAAIVSREMGIPAVVGTDDATKKLKDGDEITVDGNSGKVYAGKGETKLVVIEPIVPTKIKIKVIADLPAGAERAAKAQTNSIGLTRLEGIIATGGKHPLGFVKDKQIEKYIALLVGSLKEMLEHYDEIWIRSSDIRTDEYSNLEGAPKDEEPNPMMGDHGIRFSLKHPEILKAEFMAVKEIADEFPKKKIGLMVPLVISVDELKQAKKIAEEVKVGENVKIGIMVETPAAVQIIDDLCKEGLDFISFGTNDLTQFTLAIDRNNEDVQDLFDETHPAVLASLSKVIQACKKYGVETSICGQAGSKPAMAKFLVKEGIDSISVNADAAAKISKIVAEIEGGQAPSEQPTQPEPLAQTPPTEQPKEEPQSETPAQTETPTPTPTTMGLSVESFDKDIEASVLEALEGEEDYQPGDAGAKSEIPPLNEAIPVDSSALEEQEKASSGEEIEIQVEQELEGEIKDSLGGEWRGEKKKHQ